MRKRTVAAAAGLGLAAAAISGGIAVAGATGDGEAGSSDFTQEQADAATTAALGATGGGTANSVERDSENGATWEVEVTRPDGSTVDVRLDRAYGVVVIEGDTDTGNGG